MKAEET